jgi:PKD domain-containing protein
VRGEITPLDGWFTAFALAVGNTVYIMGNDGIHDSAFWALPDADRYDPRLHPVFTLLDAGGGRATLDAKSSSGLGGVPIASYRWELSDGTVANGVQLPHAFSPGLHRVVLTIKDLDGRTNSARQLFMVGDQIDRRPFFHRGDPNSSGDTDLSDSIDIFGFLFLGHPPALSCKESADVNNDGMIDISDGIYILEWLFLGGPEPAEPGPTGMPCGFDPDPLGFPGDLGCESYARCS